MIHRDPRPGEDGGEVSNRVNSYRIACTKQQKRSIDAFRRLPGPRIVTRFCLSDETGYVLVLHVPARSTAAFEKRLSEIGIRHGVADQWEGA